MSQYEQSLRAMDRLLTTVGEDHWAKWIREDISHWQNSRDVSHHLSAYGGMGSFNDVWICAANRHTVTDVQEPWANTLFEWLKSVCYYLAKHPDDDVSAAILRINVGRYDSSLAAFVGGDKTPAQMRGYANDGQKLKGWRCLHCGHSEVSNYDIDCFMAGDLLPEMVFRACEASTVSELVDKTLALDVAGIEELRREIRAGAKASDIAVSGRAGWMRTCPNCGRDDTAVYRWNVAVGPEMQFKPADDNLPMRK